MRRAFLTMFRCEQRAYRVANRGTSLRRHAAILRLLDRYNQEHEMRCAELGIRIEPYRDYPLRQRMFPASGTPAARPASSALPRAAV